MLRLSSSQLSTYQTCHRLYYFRYVLQVEPQGRQLALEFGAAWGQAMDRWHQGGTLDESIDAFETAYPPSDDAVRNRTTAKLLLQAYAARWPRPELFTVQQTEAWIEAPLTEDIAWCGKLDKVVAYEGATGFPLEHKSTTSYLTQRTLQRYLPNLQIIGYGFLGRTQGLAPKVQLDLTHVSRTAPKFGERFLRYEIDVHPWQLKEFEESVTKAGTEIRGRWEEAERLEDRTQAWQPNWNACQNYGGCAYLPLCKAAPNTRTRLIQDEYQPRVSTTPTQEIESHE